MINPNICKMIYVEVEPAINGRQFATYKGQKLEINDYRHGFAKPGNRRLYLTFSIMTDSYWLSVKA